MAKTNKNKVIYPDLSYKIVGILYDVYNEVGSGHKEKYYQNAISHALKEKNINFREQVYCPLFYKDKKIGKYYFDFLIEEKIILEIKIGSSFKKQNLNQVISYLKVKKLKLGIIANFTRSEVKYYRVLNIK